jgi:hypothetical protein
LRLIHCPAHIIHVYNTLILNKLQMLYKLHNSLGKAASHY